MTFKCKNKLSYNTLKEQNGNNIGYGDLLLTSEWCVKREEVIKRDENQCTRCKSKETIPLGGRNHAEAKVVYFYDKMENKYDFDVELVDAEKPVILHVHHRYYIMDKLPWDYKSDALITLCHECHNQVHHEEQIPVYSTIGELYSEISPCTRCQGSGYLPHYSHVKGGICFLCSGSRFNKSIFTIK